MNLPLSTYRIQFHKGFTFQDLLKQLDYLDDLGVHTIYASPILASRPGSTHGYDVVDPHKIDPEIGTLEELKQVVGALKQRGMMWIQDIVPNHMAFDPRNARLMDVLERGLVSPYYHYFDINWSHFKKSFQGKVAVPFLGDELETCIEKGEVKLVLADDGLYVSYYETRYPLSVPAIRHLHENFGLKILAPIVEQGDRKGNALSDWKEFRTKAFSGIHQDPLLLNIIDKINNDKSSLHQLLDLCYYQLMYWKHSEYEINYRRFFTVNELICLRMEDKFVFDEYHQFIYRLYSDGLIQGVRIDHIDGLFDPSGYVVQLRRLLGKDCYIIAEKILEAKEGMPEHWPLEGTSGYEFLSFVSQLITERRGGGELLKFYQSLLPDLEPYDKMVIRNKRMILDQYMRGEWDNLLHLLKLSHLDGDREPGRLREALAALMQAMPVYRIYPDRMPLEGNDRKVLQEAFQKALLIASDYQGELDYFKSLFLAEVAQPSDAEALFFLKRLMQFTGPLTAKGVEDTTFYVYNPLISHDEVGDAPSTLGISVNAFHAKMSRRWKNDRYSLNATATHDTKRGEDARIRLNVLSELPETWQDYVLQWMQLNKALKREVKGVAAPSVNDEYFIYQSLIGGFPETLVADESFLERVGQYLTKAVREAKEHSNWSEPDEAYEKACIEFVRGLFKPDHGFVSSFTPFLQVVLKYAEVYSLIQTVIKMTAPGIPDIYQGCELWDLSFVDPDNRRPVDYQHRREIVGEINLLAQDSLALLAKIRTHRSKGWEKMFVIQRLLQLRKSKAKLMLDGEYVPLNNISGNVSCLAYARIMGDQKVLVVLPLAIGRTRQTDHPYAESPFNAGTVSLPADCRGAMTNIFTDERIILGDHLSVFDAFKDFPVAVYVSENN